MLAYIPYMDPMGMDGLIAAHCCAINVYFMAKLQTPDISRPENIVGLCFLDDFQTEWASH